MRLNIFYVIGREVLLGVRQKMIKQICDKLNFRGLFKAVRRSKEILDNRIFDEKNKDYDKKL